MATRWSEMKPGDFLKAISSWDNPRSVATLNSKLWIPRSLLGLTRVVRLPRLLSIVGVVYTRIMIVRGGATIRVGLIRSKFGGLVLIHLNGGWNVAWRCERNRSWTFRGLSVHSAHPSTSHTNRTRL